MSDQSDSIEHRVQTVLKGETDVARWSNPDNLENSWEPRSRFAATLIPKGSKILDLGCGKMSIEKYLHPSCTYLPADIVKRDERTLHCDINKGDIPQEINQVDIVVMLGVIEYVFDLPRFLKTLAQTKKKIVVSYCDTDTGNAKDFNQRTALGWVNAFSRAQLRNLFNDAGLTVFAEDQIDNLQWIYTLVPQDAIVQTKRVAVLSYSNIGNFGDRLGMHLLSSIMPSHAIVDHLYFEPWVESDTAYDLLILGIGNSIYAPLLTNRLLALVSRAKVSIGIFGTQYRNEFPADRMKALVSSLDYWFARYQDDLELYATPNTVCRHLGDWLIKEFTLAIPTIQDTILKIGNEVCQNLPMDRIIQQIHAYRKVSSERLHPLLCALTSAEEVAYQDQRETGSGQVAGKFQSMLVDVFGRTYPEGQFWKVDRSSVIRYRQNVVDNIMNLERLLYKVL